MIYTLADIQSAATDCAADEWGRVVRDPHDAGRLVDYHEVSGAGWAVAGGYEEREDFWCGVFAGFCYARAGEYLEAGQCVDVGLKEVIGEQMFPSTTRLAGRGPYGWNHDKLAGISAPVNVDPSDVRCGDIVVVRTGRTGRVWGDHVTLARGVMHGDNIPTYEGNAVGRLGDGSSGEGVIRAARPVADVAAIYRPQMDWFVGSVNILEA